jgi:steroid 5-alpha reductase family enzyme
MLLDGTPKSLLRQRKNFKDNPQNKRKLYTKGFFRFARHINYGAYILRKSSQALMCGGWKWCFAVFTYHFLDFAKRGVPFLTCIVIREYAP